MAQSDIHSVVSTTQDYYDGPADEIYRTIWGDNIHLGVPRNPGSSHLENMEYTNELMAEAAGLSAKDKVIDLGCGYGATARFLAAAYGCHVTGTNISEKELDLARERAAEAGLQELLTFDYSDFHDLGYPDGAFDVVWSQEAFLHAVDKAKVLSECHRVLASTGQLVFTDVLVRRDTPQADRERIYDRVKSPDMWDMDDYLKGLANAGFNVTRTTDWSEHVAGSYGWVRDRLREHRDALSARIPLETIDRTIEALSFWVDSANKGNIGWALYVANKAK